MGKNHDLEWGYNNNAGDPQIYPMMMESPELRWGFIRKVYSILAIQLILTVAVAAVVVFYRPIPEFILHNRAGLPLYICLTILPFVFMIPLYCLATRHPWNYIFLALFTISLAFAVGLSCAFTKGTIVLEAAILTSVAVISLTAYTFWAVKRGKDFNFMGPFLFGALLVLLVFGLIQALFPLGKTSVMIYGCLGAIIFCGYIVYDTDNLIKRYTYDDYIWAAVSLYLDIINLFLTILIILGVLDD
ncbi:hypothetical protein ACFE04_004731 [Oxalis oulophora]